MAQQFMEGAYLLVFETCCRIHKCISLEKMAEHLNLDPEEAEATIVELIRDSNLAKANIDSEKQQIIVPTQTQSSYQQVIDFAKTRKLEMRTNQLIDTVGKKYAIPDDGAE